MHKKEIYCCLDDLIDIGVERVLTSGLDVSVLEGLPTIRELVLKVFIC